MDDVDIDEYAEQYVRVLARVLTSPRPHECLLCYVLRMLNEFGCDTSLRFAVTYRDQQAPRATALEVRLGADSLDIRRGGRKQESGEAEDDEGCPAHGVTFSHVLS